VVRAVAAAQRERDRVATLRGWAEASGWQFVQRPTRSVVRHLTGRGGRPTLLLAGYLNGRGVALLEHEVTETTGSGESSSTQTHYYVDTEVRLRQSFPSVKVTRRGKVSRLGRSIFGDRATAVNLEAFDSVYRVEARDADAARRVLSPPVVAAQITGQLPNWNWHVEGVSLHCRRGGRIGPPAGIPAQVTRLLYLADLLDPPPPQEPGQ
jgi:hypothetical protein